MNKYIIFLILLFLSFLIFYYIKNPLTPTAIINGHKIYLELAVTPKEKELGLSYRKSLPSDHGMLFTYDHKEKYGFWMNQMNFPLDFVWIDGNIVADITRNVPVLTNGQFTTLQPKVEINKILELNSGIIDKLSIKIGDAIIFKQ